MKRFIHRRWKLLAAILISIIALGMLFRVTSTHPIDSYNDCANAGDLIIGSDPPVCRDGNRNYVGPRATAAPAQAVTVSQPFDILVEGDSGGTYPRKQEVITDQAGWQHYWATVHAALPAVPPLIPVDFSTSEVVAISEGRQVTTGYNYEINAIATSASGTQVQITESIPTVSCTVQPKPTNRYFIVRTTRLAGPISYATNTEHRHCP